MRKMKWRRTRWRMMILRGREVMMLRTMMLRRMTMKRTIMLRKIAWRRRMLQKMVEDGDVENDDVEGDVEEEDWSRTYDHTLCEPAQSKYAWTCQKSSFVWNLQETLCASLRSRNACEDFTRATLYGNSQGKMPQTRVSPDQAPAFTPTVRTLQCGHTVWGTLKTLLFHPLSTHATIGAITCILRTGGVCPQARDAAQPKALST